MLSTLAPALESAENAAGGVAAQAAAAQAQSSPYGGAQANALGAALRDLAMRRETEALQALICAGTSVDQADAGGWTPLHWVCWKGPSSQIRHTFASRSVRRTLTATGQSRVTLSLR